MSENKQIALALLKEAGAKNDADKIAMAQVYATLHLAEQIALSKIRGE